MRDIYKYLILNDIGLIIQYHQNNLTYDGIKKLKLAIIKDKGFNPDFGFIVDCRKANIAMNIEELIEYGAWVAENLKLNGLKRIVLLTRTPAQVAKSTIYALNEKIAPLNYQVFSTMEASLEWLHIDPAFTDRVEMEIRNLSEFQNNTEKYSA